jgi:hypothetical protein
VEKANHSAAQRWWRTVADDASVAEAQAGLDRLAIKLDDRRRVRDGEPTTVAALATDEALRPPPLVAFPAEFDVTRTVTPQAPVSFRGNHYSIPPGLGGAAVHVRHRLGADTLRIVTAGGSTVAVHHRALDGAGRVIRDDGHVAALEKAVLGAFTSERPCTHKTRRPPRRRRWPKRHDCATRDGARGPVAIDLSAYAATAARLDRAPTDESREG